MLWSALVRDLTMRGAVVGAVAALAACAAPAEPAKMVPSTANMPVFSSDSPFRNGIYLDSVGGGEKTDPALVSKVDNAALGDALRQTLQASGLMAHDRHRAAWRLKVFLIDLKYPGSGFTTTVDSFVRYTLTRSVDGAIAFDDVVRGSFTVTVGDVFVGVERLKVANEGSIRANITEFLKRLRRVDVRAVPPPRDRGSVT